MTQAAAHHIWSSQGEDYGVHTGATPAESLLAMCRDAGYGPGVVWLDGDDLAHDSESTRRLCGGVNDWTIEPI